MSYEPAVYEYVIESQRAEIARLQRTLARLKQDEAKSRQQHLGLEEQLAQANRRLYGASSEKLGADALPALADVPERETEPQTGHGPTEQPELIEAPCDHVLDEADCVCPKCGEGLSPWQGQFEESEEVDVMVERYVLMKHRRQKYRCGCGHIETALGPDKLLHGGRYTTNFAVDVAVKKYSDHLPLDRQVKIAKRAGLVVTSQTLWDQINAVAHRLAPLEKRLLEHLHGKDLLGADETTWRMLNKRAAKRHYVWAICSDDAVLYRIADTRGVEGARPLLDGYTGTVMADDYSVYQSLAKAEDGFTLTACWAHVRRKFFEALDNEPRRAKSVMALIGELYRIEREVDPDDKDADRSRARLRRERSQWVLEALREWSKVTDTLPGSSFGKAVAYLKGCFPRLERFVRDPHIPLDNNATERALRGVVVGRKNHYGSKSKRGAEVTALMYSLVESAKLNGVSPRAYLKYTVDAAVAGRELLLPHEMAAAISSSHRHS